MRFYEKINGADCMEIGLKARGEFAILRLWLEFRRIQKMKNTKINSSVIIVL